MENLPATIEEQRLPLARLNIEDVLDHVNLIQNVMKRVMKEDEHYGVIPGTNKPTLYQPGAQKLCLTFRLGPKYEMLEAQAQPFIKYRIRCTLYHIPTGQFIAEGIGSCNSHEIKYRYRSENTGRSVPKEYWESRDSALLGGPQFKTRKKDGQWMIFETIENENPDDLDNTILKMACKRGLVAATLNATAASDIFTQDVEDMSAESLNSEQKKPEKSGASPIKEKKQSLKKKDERSASKLKELQEKLREAASVEKDAIDHGEEKPNILRSMWKSMYEESQKDLTLADFRMLEKLKDELKKEIDESGGRPDIEGKEPGIDGMAD